MSRPEDARYAESHEWVRPDGDVWLVGITDHAVEELSDLVALELPEPGSSYKRGESFGEVESVKAVSELYAPADLEVVEAHTALADDLDALARDAFGAGWLLKVRLADPGQLEGLMDRAAYDKHVAD